MKTATLTTYYVTLMNIQITAKTPVDEMVYDQYF